MVCILCYRCDSNHRTTENVIHFILNWQNMCCIYNSIFKIVVRYLMNMAGDKVPLGERLWVTDNPPRWHVAEMPERNACSGMPVCSTN